MYTSEGGTCTCTITEEVGTHHHVRYHVFDKLRIHELNSIAILYREDGLSFLRERWSYHLQVGKRACTTGRLLTSTHVHANEDWYSKCTPFAGALEAFVHFAHPMYNVLEAGIFVALLFLSLTKQYITCRSA